MAIEVFNRFELKFKLNEEKYRIMQEALRPYAHYDAYSGEENFYKITSLYFDTPHDEFISQAVNKYSKFHHKLRLRSYDTQSPIAFIEIKKKVCGISNKRRSTIAVKDAVPFVVEHKMPEYQPYHNPQVLTEIDTLSRQFELTPKTLLYYERQALVGNEDSNLRMTFDRNIRCRRDRLDLPSGEGGGLLIGEGYYLMEIKVSQAFPLWLCEILSKNGIYRQRFSKYGTEFSQHVLQEHKKGEIVNAD